MPSLIDSKIANCKSWADFEQLVAAHENKDKGDLFERLTQLFLQTSPTYKSKIRNVWWCNNPYTNEFPEAVRQKLNLPEEDEGIDLICETFEGKYWSVQAKYRTDNDKALTTKELSKFLSLSFVTSGQIELGLITHTSTKPVRKQDLMGHTTELGLQNFLEMSPEQWEQIAGICANNAPLPPIARTPEPFQRAAIANAIKHFQTKDNARGKLIMPCGTGKSLMAYWMAREMNAKSIILAVPSLALIKQSLGDWTAEFLAEGIRPEWLAVCSDDSVGSMKEADSTVSTVYEAGIPATTDQFEIVEFLEKTTDVPKVIFTTYQSSEVLAEACTNAGFTAELLIADEAHKTVGSSAKKFATLLSDDNIHINKRLFMTATERVIRGAGEGKVVSMDDESVYGKVFHQMSFAEAIAEEIICDYKILTLFISEDETAHLVSEKQALEAQQGNKKIETDAYSLAVGLAVEKAFKKYGIKRAITFHSSIKRAENFVSQQRELSGLVDEGIEIDYQTISSKQTAGQRSKRLNDFKSKELALLSNARCLTEGVDIPSIDCVAFVDPKQSVVDIVQAAGRAMRQSRVSGKKMGYILLPVAVPAGMPLLQVAETSDFKEIAKVIAALSTQDERLVEELKTKIHPSSGYRLIIDAKYDKNLEIDFEQFASKIRTEIWKSVGRANVASFQEARDFARKLKFKNSREWAVWASGGKRPPHIPSSPNTKYLNHGWEGWANFLGRETKEFTFEEAKKHLKSLKLGTKKEFRQWVASGEAPETFPSVPERKYSEFWKGWGDFLNTENTWKGNWLPFERARRLAHTLNISTQKQWNHWSANGGRPSNIPSSPAAVYRDAGWNGWRDFLGEEEPPSFLSFREARAYVRKQKLANQKDWVSWCKKGERPPNIPSSPSIHFKEKGWTSWGDFLGTGNKARRKGKYLPFQEARELVRSKNFKSHSDWNEWRKKERPSNIPSNPAREYSEEGWSGWSDFFGASTANIPGQWKREEDPET